MKFTNSCIYAATVLTTSTIFTSLRATAVRAFVASSSSSSFTRLNMSSCSATVNPLLQQTDLPKFATIQPSDVTPAVKALLSKLETDFETFEEELRTKQQKPADETTITYDDVLPEIEKMQFALGYTWGVAGHLNGVANGDELRTAVEENQGDIVQMFAKFSQSKPMYDALEQIQKLKSEHDNDTFVASQKDRAVELSLRGMKLGGVGLTGDDKVRFNEIKTRLAEIGTKFGNNVLDETKAFSITVSDASKLEGVPDSAKAMWANAHVNHLKSEAKKDDDTTEIPEMDAAAGPWRITLDMPSYIAVLSHVPDRDVRQSVYMANIQRASEQSDDEKKNNVPYIYEVLSLKQEMATLLGYNNYAEQSLAAKMAPSIDSVRELSDLILEKALPAAEKELAGITDLAKTTDADTYGNVDKLMPWDTTFWSERLKETKFDLKEEDTRPYFALPEVLNGMFSLLSRLFNVRVEAADGATEVWNDDVRFFKVFDMDSDTHIASFFLDPYSRPENKRGGAWMDVCVGKSEATAIDVPVAYLTCNGSPPVGDTPSLMTFREVETLFHETGHGLQHMLTKATIGDVAGINGVEWDAVELPSQFMENWCYDEPTVYGFAKHWKTGEAMPKDMFQKLKDQKTFNAGMMSCRQLLFGQLDMELHSGYDTKAGQDGSGESIFDVQRRMAQKYTPYNLPLAEDRFLCTFQHIFAGGYAAGYFSYKWAEVMSADAFSAFEDAGLDNEDAVKSVGMQFRDTVLSLGGGVDPMTVFKQFRGREPNPDALLRHSGLA